MIYTQKTKFACEVVVMLRSAASPHLSCHFRRPRRTNRNNRVDLHHLLLIEDLQLTVCTEDRSWTLIVRLYDVIVQQRALGQHEVALHPAALHDCFNATARLLQEPCCDNEPGRGEQSERLRHSIASPRSVSSVVAV